MDQKVILISYTLRGVSGLVSARDGQESRFLTTAVLEVT